MRTIKFRGKSILNDEWLYGDLVHSADKNRFAILVNTKDSYNECGVVPETVGQFTGLYDCYGKEIYEGDILRCEDLPNLTLEVYWNREFDVLLFFVRTDDTNNEHGSTDTAEYISQHYKYKVIGNIYD